MRLPSIVVSALAAGAILAFAGVAAAQTTHVADDNSAAYTVPAGIVAVANTTGTPGQSVFAINRVVDGRSSRVGSCVLQIKPLKSRPSHAEWSMLIAQNRDNTEQMARALVQAPDQFVSLGGYRDLIVGSETGYAYWFDARRATGQINTRVNFSVVMMPDRLYGGACNGFPGVVLTPSEIDRIITLVSSARRP